MRNKLAIAALLALLAVPLCAQTIRPTRISQIQWTELTTAQEAGMTLAEGSFWYNTDLNCYRGRGAASTGCILSGVVPIQQCHLFAGADAGAKITACIAAVPATGGIADARGLEGAQAISTTITVNKQVMILLGHATYTTSVAPAFDFGRAGRSSYIIGVGTGSSTEFGTRILAANGTLTPLVRIQGTNTSTRATVIHLENFTIEGVFTVTQIGLFVNFASEIFLKNVRFAELGQAEDIDDVFTVVHEQVNYFNSGSGGTAATATVRVERRSGGPAPTERISWNRHTLWQGDSTPGNNKQGTAVWVGPNTQAIEIGSSSIDYNSTNPDFPIVHFDKVNLATIHDTTIVATTITTANGVVEVTGDSGTRSSDVHLINNIITTSATVPAVYFDWSGSGSVLGGTLRGLGTGTAITVTVNANATRVIPAVVASLTTILNNSSFSTNAMLPGQGNADDVWQFPDGIAVGTGSMPTAGLIRAANGVIVIQQRNAADSGDVPVIFLDGVDAVQVGSAAANTHVMGTLGVGTPPLSEGVTIKNNVAYIMLDAGGASVLGMKVDASDILRIGDDADLASIVLGRAAVPVNALEGAVSNIPRWILKIVDHTDLVAAGTADDFVLWTLPANTMIHDVVGTVVAAWAGTGPVSAAVCSVGTAAGPANGLALDDNFFATGTRYELHDGTATGGKGSVLFDSTDKFAPHLLLAGGDIEIQCDLTGGNHDTTSAGQARIYILVSQPLGNTTTEAN